MRKEMIQEIESARPEFLVYAKISSSWWEMYPPKGAMSFFSWADHYVGSYYERVGIADILRPDYTEYHWGEEAATYQPRSQQVLEVFKRKM